MLACLTLPGQRNMGRRTIGEKKDFRLEMKKGIKYTFSDRLLRKLLLLYGILTFCCVPAGYLSGLFVRREFGGTYWYLTAAEVVGPGISPAETAGPMAAEAAAADRVPRRRRAGPTAETEASGSEMARMARCLRIRYYCFSLRLGYLHLVWTLPAEKRKRQLDKAAAEAVETVAPADISR